MSASAMVGLMANLAPWRKGMLNAAEIVKDAFSGDILNPFDTAVKKSAKKAERDLGSDLSKNIKGWLAGAVAGFTFAKITIESRRFLEESLTQFNAYADSAMKLQAALGTLDAETKIGFDPEGFDKLRENLRLALGTGGIAVNEAMADFITRGFDAASAQKLTVLAANYAAKTGKPLEDVARKIGDAASGQVDVMKELGVQIDATGDRSRDAIAAVEALQAAYGSAGNDLANPTDRMTAAVDNLFIAMGEKLAPILNPLIEDVADFVNGLMATEDGNEILQDIADTVAFLIEFFKQAAITVDFLGLRIEGAMKTVKGSIEALVGFLAGTILDSPGGKLLAIILGIEKADVEALQATFNEMATAGVATASEGVETWKRGGRIMFEGEQSRIEEFAGRTAAAGARVREQAIEEVQRESEAVPGIRNRNLESRDERAASDAARKEFGANEAASAREYERMVADSAKQAKDLEARQAKEREAAAKLQQQLGTRMQGRGNVGPGSAIIIGQRAYNPLRGAPVRRVGGGR